MTDLPRDTVTSLFTAIEGSTALWEQDRVAMRRWSGTWPCSTLPSNWTPSFRSARVKPAMGWSGCCQVQRQYGQSTQEGHDERRAPLLIEDLAAAEVGNQTDAS